MACALCSDLAEGAVVSTCGHTFCRQCLGARFADAAGEDEGEDRQPTLHCPQCRARLAPRDMLSASALAEAIALEQACPVKREGEDPVKQETACPVKREGAGAIEEEEAAPHVLLGAAASETVFSTKIQAAMRYLYKVLRPGSAAGGSLEEWVAPKLGEEPGGSEAEAVGVKAEAEASCVKAEAWPALPCKAKARMTDDGRSGDKVLIFSQWTAMLDLMEAPLHRAGCVAGRGLWERGGIYC